MSALTTWLTAIADAIRGKDGTALPIDHIDFPAKIAAIPQLDTSDATLVANDMLYGVTGYGPAGTKLTGAGAYWQYVKNATGVFRSSDIVGDIELYLPNSTNFYNWFDTCTGITSINLTCNGVITSIRNICSRCSALTSITLNLSTTQCNDFQFMFEDCVNLVSVAGTPLDMTNCSNVNLYGIFVNCSKLTAIAFAANTLKQAHIFRYSPLLSTASLLSIANGLHQPSAPKTLTMHATSKTNMDNINVDNVDGVAVLGSAMTLTQFINNVKEWTIA